MIVFNELSDIKGISPTVVALGNFDGIHKGHQELLKAAIEDAKERGLKSAVFTFSNHPKNELSGYQVVKNIIYDKEKLEIMNETGIDYLFSIRFDSEIQHMDPITFIKKLLIKSFKVSEAICGFNYRFGFKAEGNHVLLKQEGLRKGFDVRIIDAVTINETVVSSTLIRNLISDGSVDCVRDFMGRNYAIRGEVIHGNELGRTLGFPTANIWADDNMILPPNGVYVTYCIIDGNRYDSITNIGNKPTIGEFQKNLETNVLDMELNLYGKTITVEFLEMIRTEQKFGTIDALKKQIALDSNIAREYHENIK